MITLQVGQSATCEIPSRPHRVPTGVKLEQACSYELIAGGLWKDWNTECGPDGYPSPNALLRAAERWRRVPSAPWFALIGMVGESGPFVIGTSRRVNPENSGELVCFANDVPLFYFNNSGTVTLDIRRMP